MTRYACLGLLLTLPMSSMAADTENGRQLHDDNCMRCHDSSAYTRQDRRVGSYEALEHRVDLCHGSLGMPWNEQDLADVTAYLNEAFYKFTR